MEASRTSLNELPSSRLFQALGTPEKLLAVLAVYFVAQIVLRLITSSTADLDEAEQLLVSQQLGLGYGAQPPLYAWLQYPLIKLFGPTILPLAILKNLLLFCIYAVTYFTARRVARDHWLAVVATASLLFFPQIAWESQRDLSHSILVTLCAATAFLLFLMIRRGRRTRDYLIFGVVCALGVLAKYNFFGFLAGLLLASLTLPALREATWDKRMWLALLLAGVLIAPHLWWVLHNPDSAFAATGKFRIRDGENCLKTAVAGLGSLFIATTGHVSPLLGIYWVVCAKRPDARASHAPDADVGRLIGRAIGIILIFLLAAIFLFQVTQFRNRWFLPVFFWLPIWLSVKFAPRLVPSRLKWLLSLAVGVGIVVLLLIPARVRFAESLGMVRHLNAPFDQLCAQIRAANPQTRWIFADNDWFAGNLKLFLPDRHILSAKRNIPFSAAEGAGCVLIWDATRQAQPPDWLTSYAAKHADFNLDAANFRYVEAPVKHFRTTQMRLGMLAGTIKPNTP